MYNLIAGYSYFFEGDSADIVGYILAVKRNSSLDISYVAKDSNTSKESLLDFFEQLESEGLLVRKALSSQDIEEYRHYISQIRTTANITEKTTVEKLPMDVSNAEQQYSLAIDNGHTIASAMFELTYNCSEKCIHCYNPGATRNDNEVCYRADRKELTIEEYKRIIDELYDTGLFKVCLSGGDPFSKPIVWDIIDYLYHKDIAFDVFTNGQRIINETERLADYYPRTVGVSIYSGIESDHDAITRTRGSWARSISVVEKLSALAVPMNLKCCIMQPNVNSYYMVDDFAKKYGCEVQYEINITESIEGDVCAKRLRLNEDQLKVILRDDNIKMYVGPEAPNFGGQPRDMNENGCGAGDTGFCITPEGKLRPCCAFPMDLGDLRQQSVTQILSESSSLKEWRSAKLSDYEECGKHDYCGYCNLCAGINYTQHSDYRKPAETNCYMAKVRYNLAKSMQGDFVPWSKNELINRIKALKSDSVELAREYIKDK